MDGGSFIMSWDIIALDWNIDKDKLRSWYLEVERQSEPVSYTHLRAHET